MSLNEIIYGGGGALLVFLTIVQIAPIKIDPWTAIGRAVGRVINQDVITKVDKLDVDVRAIKEDAAEQVAVTCRARILRFGDEVLHGERHTKEHFDQILRDITEYEAYCSEHPKFINNMTALTSERIKQIYMKCMEDNDFL